MSRGSNVPVLATRGSNVPLPASYRVYRLSRILPKVWDPPKCIKKSSSSSFSSFFPRKFKVLGVEEKKREEEGKGEGEERERGGECGYWLLDILDGPRATNLRSGSGVSLDGHLCTRRSSFRENFASKRYVFQLFKGLFSYVGPGPSC